MENNTLSNTCLIPFYSTMQFTSKLSVSNKNNFLTACLKIIGFRRNLSLSHVDITKNLPKMVDVSSKNSTLREAHSRCFITFPANVFDDLSKLNCNFQSKKGPIISTSIVAGIMAVKRTSDLIPFCHPIPITSCDIQIDKSNTKTNTLEINCYVKTSSQTGVEMEALTGASTAALTVYDMCKALSQNMVISDLRLVSKTGGKSDYCIDDSISTHSPPL